ncbi:sensor c-di-GMP phosphodiesterase-like protein [Paucimonas lemoignei]|uniref:cyclic-guanylate-specific phosphodiesterase n=1 Tax=Paucimonas lemoignei TaxID=29443 RepID=A0A4R3HXH1_PAULE|nr:EAL domain-containing protein [Paucimonas lemoignei]TCS37524.1 sensor c-di-GMP phosphodiesterase-like protein [Paucimonas lemoignei]
MDRPSGLQAGVEETPVGKRAAIAVALFAGLVAIAVPILVSLYLASMQSLEAEEARALALAAEVVRRSDETSEQIYKAFAKLGRERIADPCSPANIERMREIDLSSTRLQAVGYIAGNKLLCSSLGSHGAGIPVGLPNYVNTNGVSIRSAVELAFVPGSQFTISTQEASGYAAIVHRSGPLDVMLYRPGMSIGLVGRSSGELILNRGPFKPEPLQGMRPAQEIKRFDGKYVFAAVSSRNYDYIAYAAVPAVYLDAGTRQSALVLVPVGIIAGLVLALAVYYLTRRQLSMPTLLRNALRAEELFLLYQPIVDLQSGTWHGAEALLRWRRPDGNLIRPDVFISVAEASGLIRQVTQKVMALVVRDTAGLLKRYEDFHIGINVAAADLKSGSFINELHAMLRRAGVGAGSIMVEATERGFLETEHAAQIIRDIRKTGICVAVDDFGTGYSSLSYLTSFELDYLKIDKSFVDTIGVEAATSQVIPHIIEMAKSLNLRMIAEGVESEAQMRYLRERGVQYGQGWLFGKPMSIGELASQLAQNRN